MPHQDLIVKGNRWPSVTEIVASLQKPGLENWKAEVGEERAQRIANIAAIKGRKFHSLIEKFLKGETISFCGEDLHRNTFKVWFDWWRDSKYECLSQELHVKSKKLKYHGTLDAIIQSADKQRGIVDWKFSNSDDPLRALQLAGYTIAYEEETSIKLDFAMIMRIETKRNRQKVLTPRVCTPWVYTNLEPYKEMFKALVKLFNKKK